MAGKAHDRPDRWDDLLSFVEQHAGKPCPTNKELDGALGLQSGTASKMIASLVHAGRLRVIFSTGRKTRRMLVPVTGKETGDRRANPSLFHLTKIRASPLPWYGDMNLSEEELPPGDGRNHSIRPPW